MAVQPSMLRCRVRATEAVGIIVGAVGMDVLGGALQELVAAALQVGVPLAVLTAWILWPILSEVVQSVSHFCRPLVLVVTAQPCWLVMKCTTAPHEAHCIPGCDDCGRDLDMASEAEGMSWWHAGASDRGQRAAGVHARHAGQHRGEAGQELCALPAPRSRSCPGLLRPGKPWVCMLAPCLPVALPATPTACQGQRIP